MNFMERLRLGRHDSARAAKERLQLVLIHDRSGLSPGKLEELKDDIIDLLSHYVEIDKRAVRISLTSDRDQQRLVADIPLAPQRSRRGKLR
jgi:cell division topological specificity factor